MSRFEGLPQFRHNDPEKFGVLLVNLGTPSAPTKIALKRYLRQFLWDPRVVEVPRLVWWLLLHGIILNTRPARSAQAYANIWTEGGSPLLVISQRQRAALQQALSETLSGPVAVSLGMRYGQPAITRGLRELWQQGARRILILPLYPQYAGSTVGSTFDAVADTLKQWRWLPELRFVTHYHDQPAYIEAMAAHIEAHWHERAETDRLLFSFHGVPKRYLLEGDPYHCQCHATARLIAERLGLAETDWQVTFQSRFGREEWLKPYTDETLKALPGQGVKRIAVVCPGFASDCLETLEEIDMVNRELFLEAGGEAFSYIPALNASDRHIKALTQLVQLHGQGWPELAADYDYTAGQQGRDQRRARAMAYGAEA